MQVCRANLHTLRNPFFREDLWLVVGFLLAPSGVYQSCVSVLVSKMALYVFRHTNCSLTVLQEATMVVPRISLLCSLGICNNCGN